MKEIILEAFNRELSTKGKLNSLRKQGYVPGIVYGKDLEKNIPIYLRRLDFERKIREHESAFLKLSIKDLNFEKNVIIKEIQRDIITKDIIHVDFHVVSLKEEIEVKVPVELTGESKGVREGGILELVTHELKVKCLPSQIPEKIKVDISNLEIGDSISVNDLPKFKNIKITTPAEVVLAVVTKPKEVKEEEEVPPEVPEEPEVIKEKKEEGE